MGFISGAMSGMPQMPQQPGQPIPSAGGKGQPSFPFQGQPPGQPIPSAGGKGQPSFPFQGPQQRGLGGLQTALMNKFRNRLG